MYHFGDITYTHSNAACSHMLTGALNGHRSRQQNSNPHVFWGVCFGEVSFTNYKGFSCRQAPNPHIKKGLKKGMEPGEQKTPLSFTVKNANAYPKSSENKSKLQEHEQGFSCRHAAEP